MIVKGIIFEDMVNFKKPCMTIEMPYCSFKCDKECGKQVCQNSLLAESDNIHVSVQELIKKYLNNPITSAVCFQGLEPMDSWYDLYYFVKEFRKLSDDIIVIYTGYNKKEIQDKIIQLSAFNNIIVKYGRFIPDKKSHFDKTLGVNLASDNQYAEYI